MDIIHHKPTIIFATIGFEQNNNTKSNYIHIEHPLSHQSPINLRSAALSITKH